jgi:plasmid stabilization system protein ParE
MVSKLTIDSECGLSEILSYLKGEFGLKFEKNYYSEFRDLRIVMENFPEGFPVVSKSRNLRKLVFRKRKTIYYQVTDYIKVIAIIDNRQDYKV